MTHASKLFLAALALHAAAPLAAAQNAPVPASVPAPQMTVATFLARVAELAKGGPEWTLSAEAGELFAVVSSVGKAYRQELAERRAAGQKLEACLPTDAQIDSDVLFAHLAGYSAEAAANTSIAEAFAALVRERYPCR